MANLNNNNRVPNGNGVRLPNVGRGDVLRPSTINKIAEGVDRATVQQGVGTRTTRTGNSSVVSIPMPNGMRRHPWQALSLATNGERFLTFKLGNYFTIDANTNVWRDNSCVNWAGGTEYETGDVSEHSIGAEVLFDVEGANYLSTLHIQPGEFNLFPLKEGLYYLVVAPWSGRQLTGEGLSDDAQKNLGDWNNESTSRKGKMFPCLKYASKTTMKAVATQAGVVPICTVDKFGRIFQSLASDVFAGSLEESHPYKITVRKDKDNVWRIFVAYGTVNNEVPEYEDDTKKIGDPEYEGLLGIGSGDDIPEKTYSVILELAYIEDDLFPATDPLPKVYARGDWERANNPDTDDTCYIKLGEIVVTIEGEVEGEPGSGQPNFVINQAVKNSLWVERFKCGNNDAIYWATGV